MKIGFRESIHTYGSVGGSAYLSQSSTGTNLSSAHGECYESRLADYGFGQIGKQKHLSSMDFGYRQQSLLLIKLMQNGIRKNGI